MIKNMTDKANKTGAPVESQSKKKGTARVPPVTTVSESGQTTSTVTTAQSQAQVQLTSMNPTQQGLMAQYQMLFTFPQQIPQPMQFPGFYPQFSQFPQFGVDPGSQWEQESVCSSGRSHYFG